MNGALNADARGNHKKVNECNSDSVHRRSTTPRLPHLPGRDCRRPPRPTTPLCMTLACLEFGGSIRRREPRGRRRVSDAGREFGNPSRPCTNGMGQVRHMRRFCTTANSLLDLHRFMSVSVAGCNGGDLCLEAWPRPAPRWCLACLIHTSHSESNAPCRLASKAIASH